MLRHVAHAFCRVRRSPDRRGCVPRIAALDESMEKRATLRARQLREWQMPGCAGAAVGAPHYGSVASRGAGELAA